MFLFKRIFLAVAGAVGSLVLTKVVTQFLDKKPLEDRVKDGKTRVMNVQIKALDKAIEKATKMKAKLKGESQV